MLKFNHLPVSLVSLLLLQGLTIFYLYCLRRISVRKLWLPTNVSFPKISFGSSSAEAPSTDLTLFKWQQTGQTSISESQPSAVENKS